MEILKQIIYRAIGALILTILVCAVLMVTFILIDSMGIWSAVVFYSGMFIYLVYDYVKYTFKQ